MKGCFNMMSGWIMKDCGVPDSLITVIERAPSRKGRTYWLCRCECGTEFEARGDQITSGATKSCGCLATKRRAEACARIGKANKGRTTHDENIIGQKFALLTVKNFSYNENHKNYYECECECGNMAIVEYNHLKSGHTKSCGCLIGSFGARKLEEILIANRVVFKKEFSFTDLKDKSALRFDFAIFNGDKLDYLIEYQGQQHYQDPNKIKWNSPIKHDKMKQDYCREHNIKLLVIPYWDESKLSYNYILDKLTKL